jgi:hypothetical protein
MSFALLEFSVLSSCFRLRAWRFGETSPEAWRRRAHVRFWVLDEPEHELRSEKIEA